MATAFCICQRLDYDRLNLNKVKNNKKIGKKFARLKRIAYLCTKKIN